MTRKKLLELLLDVGVITLGGSLFSLAFVLFLQPNEINCGGASGAAMVFTELTGLGTVGSVSLIINIPLFLVGYRRLGKKFFFGSLLGMAASSVMIDVFALLPTLRTEPLLGAIFGGLLAGVGIGMVFARGASTGGMDIAAMLLKRKFRNVSMGHMMLLVDSVIVLLTGVVFGDINTVLYCIITQYACTIAIDGVVYGFEYSKVALIISDIPEQIVHNIDEKLGRGATYLKGEGSYEHKEKKIVLCAVKRQQLAALKETVAQTDPDAFVIVQEAHQVLGEGFGRYSKDEL